MVLIKFFFIIILIYLGFYVFWKLFGKSIIRWAMGRLVKRAQRDMERQSQVYEQYVQGHSPYEDNVYYEDDVKVSIKRNTANKKPDLNNMPIETVDFEDVD
jgi:predicted membrane protein